MSALWRALNVTAPREIVVFLLTNVAIQWGVFAVSARQMLGAIRADGGTAAEYLVYLWYNAALVLAIAWVVLVSFGMLRRFGGVRVARAGIVAAESAVLVGIGAEVLTFTILGLHPYGANTWEAVGTADIRHLPWWFFAALGAVVGGLVLSQWALLRGATRLAHAFPGTAKDRAVGGRLIGYALIGFAAFFAIDRNDAERLVPRAGLPLYSLWIAPARQFPELRPRRMIGDALDAPSMTRRPDILFLLAESLRGDMLTPEHMPIVSRVVAEHGCMVPPRHYTGGHLTQYGAFSILYGLGGWAFLPYMEEARESWPLAVLRENGYELHGFDATGVLSYGIAPLVPSQFDRYETRLRADSALLDETVELALEPGERAPRFLFTFLYSTHAPYLYPDDPGLELIGFDSTASHPVGWARYLRSVRYVDRLVGRVAERLDDRLRDGSLILVITGDHGEEFWEFGLQGHAAVRFHDVRVRVPLVLCLPGVQGAPPAVSEHADVFPTILTWSGDHPLPATAMSGTSLVGRPDSVPVIVAGSGFPERAGGFALLTPEAKFWLSLEDPTFTDIALDRVTDLDDHPLQQSEKLLGVLRDGLDRFHRSRQAVLRPD